MFTQAQLEYIEKQFGRKVSREDIIKKLAAAGWENGDIEDGLREVEKKLATGGGETLPEAPASHVLRNILFVLSGVVLVAGIGALAYWKYVWLPKNASTKDAVTSASLAEEKRDTNTSDVASSTPPAEEVVQSKELIFAEHVESCTPDTLTFVHPLVGTSMKREIVGIQNGKCVLVEEMPNNGKMSCQYTEDERKVAAAFYRDTALAASIQSKGEIALTSGSSTSETIIDGKEVKNPLQDFMQSGVCVIAMPEIAPNVVKTPSISVEETRKQYVAALRFGDIQKIVPFYRIEDRANMEDQMKKATKADLAKYADVVAAAKLTSKTNVRADFAITSGPEKGIIVFDNIDGVWLIDK